MVYERYTLRMKWESNFQAPEVATWISIRHMPYFKSEEEAADYYDRNKDFIELTSENRDVAVFKIVHDEVMIKEL